MNFKFSAIQLLALATAASSWEVLTDTQLPSPVSDHSATFIPASSSSGSDNIINTKAGIYIAGGCDSPDGNTYVDADGLELDFFMCESISDKLHVFDADSNTFTTVANLPRPRYRHAAVHADGKLWLVGGRTIPEDNVIAEVDVYDPATDSWTTVGTIPEEYLTSDNGAFANEDGSTIYVVGGYNPVYYNPDSLATTFSFDTTASLSASSANKNNNLLVEDLEVTKRADLLTGRGDIHAVSSQDGKTAYVAGGYAGMCRPLTSAEVYDVQSDTWSSAGNLVKARGDGAMVEADGTIYAIGGEVNHPDQCAAPELVPAMSHSSLAVDDVEALEYLSDNDNNGVAAVWSDVEKISEFRFRFSAASWPSTGVAYAFGGQTSFDEDCDCFPTTNEITSINNRRSSSSIVAGDADLATTTEQVSDSDSDIDSNIASSSPPVSTGTTTSKDDATTSATDPEVSDSGDESVIIDADSSSSSSAVAITTTTLSAMTMMMMMMTAMVV